MRWIRRRPRRVLFLVLFLALPVHADEAEGPAASLAPSAKQWLLLPPLDSGGRSPFRPSAVYRRHILRPDATPPKAEEILRGTSGLQAAWRAAETDPEGRVAADGARWAYAAVEAGREGIWLAELSRVGAVFLNGRAVYGDIYDYGIARMPVRLRAGTNHLFAAAFRGPFRVAFEPPPAPVFVAVEDATLPDLLRGRTSTPHAAILVVNATEGRLRGLHVEARIEAGAATAAAGRRLDRLEPLTQVKLPILLPALEVPESAQDGRLVISIADCDEVLHERSFPLAVKDPDAPHRRTFVSEIDGSVQFYGVRAPVGPRSAESEAGLVLSLHGAGVDALSQARAYSPKPDLWIIAPTNRRPFGFDWQDWGRRDAYEVLEAALVLTGVERHRVWLTGHSMGGHGTWHLAVNDPDGFGAIAPSAAWVSFDTYGHSGAASGPLDRLWRGSDLASDTLALKANLADLPIRQLHGGADDNVPASEARRMEEALDGVAQDYTLTVAEGKGHWWDGDAAPGADCVDWPPFFETFRAHPIRQDPETIRFVSAGPAVDSRHFWVTVQQPLQLGTPLSVAARRAETTVIVTTDNVRRLVLDPPAAWGVRHLQVDDQGFPRRKDAGAMAFQRTQGTWQPTATAVPTGERSPTRSGPFKRLFDRRFVLVYGTAGDDDEDERGRDRARYDTERWRYRANGFAEVLPDRYVLQNLPRFEDRNLVLYGNAETNLLWDRVLGPGGPIRLAAGKATVGARTFEGDDLAAFFLRPRLDDARALAGAVAWTGPQGERLTLRSGYLASGSGYPDYVVFGPEILERGDYGVRAAGFFDVGWGLAE